jgi:hypothetical protein
VKVNPEPRQTHRFLEVSSLGHRLANCLGIGGIVLTALHIRLDQLRLDQLHFMAIQRQKPSPGLIHHSDRDNQFAAANYRKVLGAAGMIQSMSRKGNCWDCENVGALGGPDPCCD